MVQIIPGIHRFKIPMPEKDLLLGYINVYLVKSDRGCLLVDTGWGTDEAFESLLSHLEEAGVSPKNITQIVSTHIHADHYGLSGKLKDLTGARVALHRVETELVGDRYVNMDSLLRSLAQWLTVNGVPAEHLGELRDASVARAQQVIPSQPDILLEGGETLSVGDFHFKTIWTPGHAAGHICLYEPRHKILFSGDHVLPTITPHVGRHPQSSENPLGDYMNSLKMLKGLDVSLVLPGHEEPFTGLDRRLDELIHHHEERNAEILWHLGSDCRTAFDIASRIVWMAYSGGIMWQELGFWDKRLAIMETISHLESMKFDGRVARLARNGVACYQASRYAEEK